MTTWDLYALRVRSLLRLKTLPPDLEPVVRDAFESGFSPELAADDCMLVSMGAYSSTADNEVGSRE